MRKKLQEKKLKELEEKKRKLLEVTGMQVSAIQDEIEEIKMKKKRV